MTKETYADKLKDPRWQKIRLEVFQRDAFTCQMCLHTDATLHVHHFKYCGDPWNSNPDDLITYCEYCHNLVESFKKASVTVARIIRKGEYYWIYGFDATKQEDYLYVSKKEGKDSLIPIAALSKSSLINHLAILNSI